MSGLSANGDDSMDDIEVDRSHADRVSSPISTGGAGPFFEQHVDAYWLAHLLVRGIPPILLDCSMVEIHLQTEHLGWHTDDFLIIGQNGAGNQRKLAGQVKRTFTVSATDEECKKAIGDFWKDFRVTGLFSPDTDRFALVTQRGSNTLLAYFVGLLDCSRAARDGPEFEYRLATKGFISKQSVRYCLQIRTIVGEIEERNITEAEIWPFLRVLYVLSLDLDTSTRQHEAMIKTMLAHTTTDSDAPSADASWKDLLAISSDAMKHACSLRRDDLPDFLRARHSVVGGSEKKILGTIKDHTNFILRGIRTRIGSDFHLQRADLVQQVLEQLELNQVILISGPAGSGKSAVAKITISILSQDYFILSFRAEEFAHPHFDTTLHNAQIPSNAATLEAILASQDRKILLVESMERLLEKSTRDAFSDLMTLASTDKSLRIILTCRAYSTDLVRASFLVPLHIDHDVVIIPQLNSTELTEVETFFPALSRPFENPALRRVLSNPYFLDKALQISWSADRPLPESEREFRDIFWQQIVRANDHIAAIAPRRREKVFEEIAVRRARALSAYVAYDDLDRAVVDSLRHDSLIVSAGESEELVAPAHDVLEDWAILQWIKEHHLTSEGSFQVLSEAIGTHPAVRRAYRKWVAELIERDPGAADQLFSSAVTEACVSAQFRDDTFVSLLRASSSPTFLERHADELLENNSLLLKRVIHLLRVACVTKPTWLPANATHGSLLDVPDGKAWSSVLRMVQTHIEAFTGLDEQLLLLGLIEDWTKGVSRETPYPGGAESVAAIAHWLLPKLDIYHQDSPGQRTLKVIAKIPKADDARFAALLRGGATDERDHTTNIFRDIIFSGLEGAYAARDLPDLIVSVASNYLLCSEADLRRDHFDRSPIDIDFPFGMNEGLSHKFFPASAYQGPWIMLLRKHPRESLDFLLKVFNHSADWYALPRMPSSIEPPFEIEITFADGTSRKQWGNSRLWNWYRGTSVGPYVLQSLLMALERWLFEIAEGYPSGLDSILINLLRQSDSVSITAVVASVATAFPLASGEALLVLLRSPEFIWFDRKRMVAESQTPSKLSAFIPSVHPENKIYESERKEADERPHRKDYLEGAIRNLQFGPLAVRVHEILDQHREALPPTTEQNDGFRLWRLSIHRMDLRQGSFTEVAIPNIAEVPGSDSSIESIQHHILFTPNEPEQDVKKIVDENTVRMSSMGDKSSRFMWAFHVFNNEKTETYNPKEWRIQLNQAQTMEVTGLGDEDYDITKGGPGIVAAICIRDHWQEMSGEEQNWCVEIVCSEVIRHANVWNYNERMQRNNMSADRSCAWVIPVLIGKSLSETQRFLVDEAFMTALTHSIEEVRRYAAWGVSGRLWSIDRNLSIRCVNALATEATLVDQALATENSRPYDQRRQYDAIVAEAASSVRQQFWRAGGISEDSYQNLNTITGFGAEANGNILAILSQEPTEPLAISAFTQAAQSLVGWWKSDDERTLGRSGRQQERSYETESEILRTYP